MTRNEIAKAIGIKLEKIRKMYHLTVTQMAATLYCSRLSYTRNESGSAIPNFFTIRNMGSQLGISLNWLILDDGPLYLNEITTVKEAKNNVPILPDDIKELLDHMEKIPLLRHETLANFHRFREEHPAMVEKAMRHKMDNIEEKG